MIELDGQNLTLEEVGRVARGAESVALSASARGRMEASRRAVVRIVSEERVVYGVTTGFGKLSEEVIPPDKLLELQINLVRSHACGLGPPLSEAETRAMLLLRANVLAKGFSGTRPVVAETLVSMLERGVHPFIPEKGSVGASGDLAPLAHLALCCVGEGEAFFEGERMTGAEAMRRAGIEPLTLEAKEGLALLNGTQALMSVGGLALERAERLTRVADVAGAMSLEALRGLPAAFDERIHLARAHRGQVETAARLRSLLEGSGLYDPEAGGKRRVQDAYSLRCMPQVHGAVRDALAHARGVAEMETGGATDNPLVFAEDDEVISGGNFHGAPLALALDYSAIALVHLGNICERRVDHLTNPDLNAGLPPFLTPEAGVASGFMVPQIAAVALLNECKVLAHPASADNLPTDGGKEDHVSMGMTAANKLRSVVSNVEYVVAIELLAAAQAVELRADAEVREGRGAPRLGRGVARALERVRAVSPRLTRDRQLSPDIERVAEAVRRGDFDL